MSKLHTLRTPERNQTQMDNSSEGYLRSKLNDAYSELENLKSVIKDIKTSDRMGLYDSNEHILKNRSTSHILSNSFNRSSNLAGTPTATYDYKSKHTYDVINQFKDTLKETEKYIHRTESVPKMSPTRMTVDKNILLSSPKSYISGVNRDTNQHLYRSTLIDSNVYPSLTEYYGKYSLNTIKDEQERVKMTNHILNRSNLDLRNQTRLLQMELESFKNNSKFANGNFEQNINEFIENMKNSLTHCQVNNKEYQEVIERLQKQNIDLNSEVGLYKEQADFTKRELELMNKKLHELKIDLEDTMNANKVLTDEKIFFQIQLNEKDCKLGEHMEKINSLLKLNESQNKNRGESNSLIESLNGTIEFLRKTHNSYDAEKISLKQAIEELQNELIKKNYDIDALTDKLSLGSKDKQFYFSELDMLRNEFKTNQKYLEELQTNYKKNLSELEKEKMRVETAELNVQEKEQIIDNMKKTINYLTKCLEEYKEHNDKLKADNDMLHLEHSKFVKNIEISELKLNDINTHLNEILVSKETLHKRNLEIESELNEKRTRLSQLEFDIKIEKQKYDEQMILINKLKEENKALKIANVENAYSLDYAKKHEETLTKINSLTIELSTKNNEIGHLKMSYEEQLRLKNEEIKKLSASLREYQGNSKERELKNEINNLQNEVDRMTRDHKRKLEEIEEQKTTLLRKYEKLNSEYQILHTSYDKLDIEYKQLSRDKRRTEDYEAELNQYRMKIEKITGEMNVMEIELKKAIKDKKLIEEYEQDKQDMARKYTAMAAELDRLMEEQKKTFKELKRIEELEYEIGIKNKKLEQLQNELDALDIDYKKAAAGKKKVEELEGDKLALQKKLEKLQDEHNKLSEDYKKATAGKRTIEELENDKLALQKKLDKLQEEFNKLSEDYKKATANKRKIEDYEIDIEKWTKKHEKLQDEFNKLSEDYKKASKDKKRADDAERELELLTKKYDKLQAEFKQLSEDYKTATKDKKKAEDFEYERKQWNIKYEKLQAELDKINELYRKANSDLKGLRDLEYEKTSLQKKYDSLRNDFERLNDENKKSISSKKKIDDLEYELTSLKKQYDKLNVDYRNLQNDYNANRSKVSDGEYNSLLVRYEKLQKEFNSLDNQHVNCSRDISMKAKLISSLQAQLDDLSQLDKKRSTVYVTETPKQVYYYDQKGKRFIIFRNRIKARL
jgi:chromosome segregation ATPase